MYQVLFRDERLHNINIEDLMLLILVKKYKSFIITFCRDNSNFSLLSHCLPPITLNKYPYEFHERAICIYVYDPVFDSENKWSSA